MASFDRITLPGALLEQMMQSALWFWEDIEFVRCNSFMRKTPAVIRKREKMRAAHPHRDQHRYWSRRWSALTSPRSGGITPLPCGHKPPVYCLLSSRQQVPGPFARRDDGSVFSCFFLD